MRSLNQMLSQYFVQILAFFMCAILVTSTAVVVVRADNVINDVAITGADTIIAGGSSVVKYRIVASSGTQDPQSSCNVIDGTPATVSIHVSSLVTASPSSLTFTKCQVGDIKNEQSVTFSSNTVGDYPVTVTVSDDGGGGYQTSSATFTLHVLPAPITDNPPTFTSIPDPETFEATGPSGAVVEYTVSATDDKAGLIVSCSPASGSTFALGTTTVHCTATDSKGQTDTAEFTVTVVDSTAPDIDLQADAVEATGASGAVVNYNASATDIVDGSVAVTCDPISGSTFPVGTTKVNCSASDSHGNDANEDFSVIVQDTTSPVLALPDNIVEEATSADGAIVTFSATATDLVDGTLDATCDPISGSTFPLDEVTTVNCSATDSANNTVEGSFTVTVQDTTPPTLIDIPGNIDTKMDFGSKYFTYTYAPTALDAVDGDVQVTCDHESPYDFPFGSTTVNCSATDAHGNPASDSFSVNVSKRTGTLSINQIIISPNPGTGFTVSGDFIDENGKGSSGRNIQFLLDGASDPNRPDTETDGITFTGSIHVDSCTIAFCSYPGPIVPGGTNVLYLGNQGEMEMPAKTKSVDLIFKGMGTTTFTIAVTQGPGGALKTAEVTTSPDAETPLSISSDIANGVPLMITKIKITSINGGTSGGEVGIASISTSNSQGNPALQHNFNFDAISGTQTSPFEVDGGKYYSIGLAPADAETSFQLTATFAGDDYYEAADDVESDFITNIVTLGDVPDSEQACIGCDPSVPYNNLNGTIFSPAVAGIDTDADGIQDGWDDPSTLTISSALSKTAISVSYGGKTGTYKLSVNGSATSQSIFGKGTGPTSATKDIYAEIDYVKGHKPDPPAISKVIDAFNAKGFKLHVFVDDEIGTTCFTSLTATEKSDLDQARNATSSRGLEVWGNTDGRANNDFYTIKGNCFGTAAERAGTAKVNGIATVSATGGTGTLASGANANLVAKLQVYHYFIWAHSMGGPSGIAELGGNDGVVALGDGWTKVNNHSVGSTDEQAGVFMHELGHQLGLRHGGGDDTNCKPNYPSVMSYSRIVPTFIDSTGGTQILLGGNWTLDYSRDVGTPSVLTETSLNEGTGLYFSNAAGKYSTAPSIIWGTPLETKKIQQQKAGLGAAAPVQWNGKNSNTENPVSIDINNLSVVGCMGEQTSLAGYDDWSNLKLNFRNAAGQSLDGPQTNSGESIPDPSGTGSGDPNSQPPDPTITIVSQLQKQASGFAGILQPVNQKEKADHGISLYKAGSVVPVKFQLKITNPDGTQSFVKLAANEMPTFTYQKYATLTSDPSLETEVTGSDVGSVGNSFKYDDATNQYVYNWKTVDPKTGKPLADGYYGIIIKLQNGEILATDLTDGYTTVVALKK